MPGDLVRYERTTLLSLRSRTDIIKPADKGLATIVMSKQDYLMKVMDHLQNEQFCLKLDNDPTEPYLEEIFTYLVDMVDQQEIDKDMFDLFCRLQLKILSI